MITDWSTSKCHCNKCKDLRNVGKVLSPFDFVGMILCPKCGNKRCPYANDHSNACTNSNATGQPGSAYP